MERVRLLSFVASIVFTMCLHSFFKNANALKNHRAPSPATRILKVGVSWRQEFTEFVSVEKNGTNFIVGGFCVKVFEASIKPLNYSVNYIPYYNYFSYDDIIRQIVLKNVDAVVGDFTITSKRSLEVLFAQPFLDSGLLAVVPLKHDQDTISFGWVFTKPFTTGMWLLIAGFFISGGMMIYILERRNIRGFEGKPRNPFRSILRFSFITWFTNQDDIRTAMGRIVFVAWFFVIGILQSCYTANLSAILTATRLEPTLNDINSVVTSNLKIGYQMGSTVLDGIIEHYRISRHRLVPLMKADYYNALSRGDVGAIVDEHPYIQSLVAEHCDSLAFAGETFTIQNWGFAFDRLNYELVREISVRILELSENGELIRLQRRWLPYYGSECNKYSDQSGTNQLQVQHFWGLFVIAGLVSAIVLLFYTLQRKWSTSIAALPTPLNEISSALIPPSPEGPTPPEDSSSHGSEGFISGEDYCRSVEVIMNNPPDGPIAQEGSSGQGGGGFISSDDYGGSWEHMNKTLSLRRTKSFANAMAFVAI